MDSKDALDLSDSVSDFQFLAASDLNLKNQTEWTESIQGFWAVVFNKLK